jgi:hypothetical protein
VVVLVVVEVAALGHPPITVDRRWNSRDPGPGVWPVLAPRLLVLPFEGVTPEKL